MYESDTIAAIATGLTDSGIGIIRISGEDAVSVGNRVFRSPSGKCVLNHATSHLMKYGYAVDVEGRQIDEVFAVVMRSPRSFTGEDIVEIQCHGGVFVIRQILKSILKNGARIAEPGEFTKRAFLNGRLDLSRAEAVMDIIHSQNEKALESSFSQLKGSLSNKIKDLRDQLIYEIAYIESALDDPEHISLDGYKNKLVNKLYDISNEISHMIDTYDDGRMIKEGINTVILGKPNAGKSSLMNRLLKQDRAIVTDIEGTTRDILQDSIRMNDISINLYDTAGIRETDNVIEQIGVEKTKEIAQKADLVIFMIDSSVPLNDYDYDIISMIKDKRVIVLLNKSDLETVVKKKELEDHFNPEYIISTSTKDDIGLDILEEKIKNYCYSGVINSNDEIIITNERHKEELIHAYHSIKLVQKSIDEDMPEDFLSIDLMDAYTALGKIIGEEVDDDLVNEIFSKFCMGK